MLNNNGPLKLPYLTSIKVKHMNRTLPKLTKKSGTGTKLPSIKLPRSTKRSPKKVPTGPTSLPTLIHLKNGNEDGRCDDIYRSTWP